MLGLYAEGSSREGGEKVINKVILQGRLVKDIELKDVGGFPMTEFTVAWSEKYKDTEHKCFLRCKAWRATAEFLSKYFKKGQELLIEGQMLTEEWEKEGQKQSRTVCNIEKVNFCGPKGEASNNGSNDTSFVDVSEDVPDEIPFK